MSRTGSRAATASAWTLCALATGLYTAMLVTGVRQGLPNFADGALWMGGFLAFAFVGALLASRRPRNALGWLLLAVALSEQLAGLGVVYAELLRQSEAAVGRLQGLALLVTMVAWMPGAALLLVLIPLTFPTGRAPTPRWRWVGWLGALAVGLLVVPAVVEFARHPDLLLLDWEDAVATLGAPLLLRASDLAFPVLLLAGGLAVSSLVVRYLRSRGEERQQLKWLAYAALLTLGFVLATNLLSLPTALDRTLGVLAVPSIAVATAVAVLRYRLYEIDRIISRTVSYALLTGLLAAVYLGAVFALQYLLRPLTGDSQLAVAGATLAVAGLFQPARRRIQASVDRRFNRARYDAQRIVEGFRGRLRDEVDLDQLRTELVGAVSRSVEPARVSLWLRGTGAAGSSPD